MLSIIRILTVFLICNCQLVFASNFPRGCEVSGFAYNGYYLVLNETDQQNFYLIQNRSQRNIEMQRVENKDVFMSPSLTARLDAEHWAAFASDVSHMQFQCFIIENNSSEKVDCREVLDICQYPRVKFALSNMGNYWVSTNKTQHDIINDAAAKGILLRW